MSGAGDIKREWDRGHQNGSWNIDSNGGFSFHHEEYSNRGIVKLYKNVKNNQLSGILSQYTILSKLSEPRRSDICGDHRTTIRGNKL